MGWNAGWKAVAAMLPCEPTTTEAGRRLRCCVLAWAKQQEQEAKDMVLFYSNCIQAMEMVRSDAELGAMPEYLDSYQQRQLQANRMTFFREATETELLMKYLEEVAHSASN